MNREAQSTKGKRFGRGALNGHDVPIVVDNPDAKIFFGRLHVTEPSPGGRTFSRDMSGFSHLILLREDNQDVPVASTTVDLSQITRIEVDLMQGSDTQTITLVDAGGTDPKVELTTGDELTRNSDTGILSFPSGRKFRVNRVRTFKKNTTTPRDNITVEVIDQTHVRVILDMIDV